jgi:hypothetical protein
MIKDGQFFFSSIFENHQIKNIMHASTNALLNDVDGPKVLTLFTIITINVYNSAPPTQQILALPQTSVIC